MDKNSYNTNYYTDEKILSKNRTNPIGFYISKRIIDIIGSIIGIFICISVAIPFYFVYKFDPKNRGPILFKQVRIGQNGKEFEIYKFRSMVVNAESVLKNNPILYKKYLENSYKLEQHEDPRITPFGRFIRKTSLDELPQFINVLKGDMSLVGPRPIVEKELEEYGERKGLFLSVKPGITGYWQISGRSDVNYPERVDVELYYMNHKSLMLDIKILLKTIIQVLKKEGAY